MLRYYAFTVDKQGNYTNMIKINARCNKCGKKSVLTIERNPRLNDKQLQAYIEEIAELCTKCRGQLKLIEQ
jgi:hypothetical protein